VLPTKPEAELQKHPFPHEQKKRKGKKGIFTKKLIKVL
jgi:hypothetical protein